MTASFTKLSSTNPQVRSSVYYLVNPASGTNTITVRFSGSTAAIGGSITYYDVNQTYPIIANVINSGLSQSTQSVALTASAPDGAVLFGHVATQIGSAYTGSDGSQQTNRWTKFGTYNHGGSTYTCAGRGSDKSYVGGSDSFTWTTTRSVNWVAIGVLPAKPASSQETVQMILSGSSNTLNWDNITWTIDASSRVSANVKLQLFNYNSGQYPDNGVGQMAGTLDGPNTMEQIITIGAANFRDEIGRWQIKFTATASVSTPFTVSLDLLHYETAYQIYGLRAQEGWTNLDFLFLNHPVLCINTAGSTTAGLGVEAWHDGMWQTLSSNLLSGWNNISISQYLSAPDFVIRFHSVDSTIQNVWRLDSVLLRPESDQDLFNSLQGSDAVVTVELLQNGTMRWLGQNLQLTTQAIPIPPIPVRALHVNQLINGVNKEVPFPSRRLGV